MKILTNKKFKKMLKREEELEGALVEYLNAGHKEASRQASIRAKKVLSGKYFSFEK